jgi:hypothetical protein
MIMAVRLREIAEDANTPVHGLTLGAAVVKVQKQLQNAVELGQVGCMIPMSAPARGLMCFGQAGTLLTPISALPPAYVPPTPQPYHSRLCMRRLDSRPWRE